jgi:hypothetical protein
MHDATNASDERPDPWPAIAKPPRFVARIDQLLALQQTENRLPDLQTAEQTGRIASPKSIVRGTENAVRAVPFHDLALRFLES